MKTHHLIRVVASLAMLATSGTAYAEEYKASTDEKAIKMTNVASLEARVQARMEKGAFGYIRGGAEDENNLRSNTESFDKKYIMPRVLQGIELKEIDLSTQLLGIPLKTPIIQHRWQRRARPRLRRVGDGERHGAGRFDFLVEHLWQQDHRRGG